MTTVAIIAEYNPFHNGHKYMLEEAKRLTGADHAIAIMSGNLLQRGTPAICDKYTRAYMSALSGIDLCLELPAVYATGSAYDFANGAVSILDALSSIDYLCFGAETDDLELLDKVSRILYEEPEEYSAYLKASLKDGLSYPAAREAALIRYIEADYHSGKNSNLAFEIEADSDSDSEKKYVDLDIEKSMISFLISSPNNILAIEYLTALRRINSDIKPIVIKRINAGYHEHELNTSYDISSATAIRDYLYHTAITGDLSRHMPAEALSLLMEKSGLEYPLSDECMLPLIHSILINDELEFTDYCDVTESLANKLRHMDVTVSYRDMLRQLTTKELTYGRIGRSLIHILLGYKRSDREAFYAGGLGFYADILSFKKDSSSLIRYINEYSRIPLITKKSDFDKCIEAAYGTSEEASPNHVSCARRMWELDRRATNLYRALVFEAFGYAIPNDYQYNLPIA